MKIPFVCSVWSGDVAVNFFATQPLGTLFRQLSYTRFIPEFRCEDTPAPMSAQVTYIDAPDQTLVFGPSKAEIRFSWSLVRQGESILYLGYPFLEQQRQQRGILTAHAAAVSLGGKGYLLLGKGGAGKTSTALSLCRNHGAKLIANDLCLLGGLAPNLALFGGSKFFYLRKESIRRNLPELLYLFPDQGGDPWLIKVFVEPEQIGIRRESETVPMAGVFLLHVDETKEECCSMPAGDLPTRLYLNENFSRYIRSTCTTMLGGDTNEMLGYVPSFDDPVLYEHRRELIRYLLAGIGVTYVSGNLRDVSARIVSLINKGPR
jgi:hypothetical protein